MFISELFGNYFATGIFFDRTDEITFSNWGIGCKKLKADMKLLK
jgi:hypothetical protein